MKGILVIAAFFCLVVVVCYYGCEITEHIEVRVDKTHMQQITPQEFEKTHR